ncbi:hypothetical protein BH748_03435 [Enterococcus casseliflavus]|uniref:hypothetical protein n=1 Tax=Enterococcus casseliflavus TaxID=37734 RepID=UPI0009BED940|nr:hypothetical protein [Enterococcus casseliflavus]OQO87214.1 hypothetical protein BH748_03435 [Enterococcus casseliflavus]
MNKLQKESIQNNRKLTAMRRELRNTKDKDTRFQIEQSIKELKASIENYGRGPLVTKPFPKRGA